MKYRPLGFETLESRRVLAAIANGEEEIDFVDVGQSDLFEFNVSADDTIRVSVGETGGNSGSANPFLQIQSPNGQVIASDAGSDDAIIQFEALLSGTYTAIVSEGGNDQSLNYRIRVASLPGLPTLIGQRDSTLANGEEEIASIPLGTFNFHQFDASTNDSVLLSIGEAGGNSGSANPFVQVFTPNGQLIASDFDSDDALITFEAVQSGTYTAIVSEGGNDQSLNYRIRVASLPGSPILIGQRDSTLANGEEEITSIPQGTFNLHQFTTSTNDSVLLSIGEAGGNSGSANPFVQIFTPNGQLIASDFDSDDALITFEAVQSGTYTAIVSEGGNDQSLNYRIRVASLPGSPILIGQRDSTLANGEEEITSIPQGTFNLHRFDVSANNLVSVFVNETSGNSGSARPFLQIVSPNGQFFTSDSDTDSAIIEFTAQLSGTYTAFVSESGNDQSLNYQIIGNGIGSTLFPSADFDNSGLVTGLDFLAWQRGFGTPAPNGTRSIGDADNDLDVDSDDLSVWQSQYGGPPPLALGSLSTASHVDLAFEELENESDLNRELNLQLLSSFFFLDRQGTDSNVDKEQLMSQTLGEATEQINRTIASPIPSTARTIEPNFVQLGKEKISQVKSNLDTLPNALLPILDEKSD